MRHLATNTHSAHCRVVSRSRNSGLYSLGGAQGSKLNGRTASDWAYTPPALLQSIGPDYTIAVGVPTAMIILRIFGP